MRAVVAALVMTLALLVTPTRAEASSGSSSPWALAGDVLYLLVAAPFLEVAIPDVRVEIGGPQQDEVSAALSWPLVMTLARIGEFDGPLVSYVRGGAEVHTTTNGATRGVFTGRGDFVVPLGDMSGVGIYGEGGYVLGSDGNGPLGGGGAILVLADGIVAALLMYRATVVDDLRHDVTLNLEFALPVYLLYQDWAN